MTLLDDVRKEMEEKGASQQEIAAELMAYKAACFIMNGPEKDERTVDPVHTASADILARRLKALGISNYIRNCYGDRQENIEPRYEHFLAVALDRMDLSGLSKTPVEIRTERKPEIREQAARTPMNYADYWLYNTKRNLQGSRYTKEDKPVYEAKISNDMWKLFIATGHLMGHQARKTVSDEEVESYKNGPLNRLFLSNERTMEKLQRGDLKGVKAEMNKLRRSFKFASEIDFSQAKTYAWDLHERMNEMESGVAQSREWRELKEAVQRFSDEEDPVKAIALSADVLAKVEKFTKGKKSVQSNPVTQHCVDLALEAISICVPDAVHNPSVKPLIDRFNKVRGRHLFQDPVDLRDFGFSAASPMDRNIYPKQEGAKVQRKKGIEVKRRAESMPGLHVGPDTFKVPAQKEQPKAKPENLEEDLRPTEFVVPKNPVAPEYDHNVFKDMTEEGEEYVPVENYYRPKYVFFNSVCNKIPLKREETIEAVATMVAAQELKFDDIYSDDDQEVIGKKEFEKRKAELLKDPAVALLTDALLEDDNAQARRVIINAMKDEDPISGKEFKRNRAGTEERMGDLIKQMYEGVKTMQQDKEQEKDNKKEDIKEEIKEQDEDKKLEDNKNEIHI
ncbi:MAG: hypothetical protein J5589_08645 [Firmicutes bacterium]|nr:hypothetical protein [Bacillota bacterium]